MPAVELGQIETAPEPQPEPAQPEPEPEPEQEPEAEPVEHPRSVLDAIAALVRGEPLPEGLHRVAMEAVVRDDWCDPKAKQLRVAMPGEALLVLERRVTPAGRIRVRLASGGWASLVASDGTVLLEEISSPLAFYRTPECNDDAPLPSASSLTHGKRYYLKLGLRVVRTQDEVLLLIADGSEPLEVNFCADTEESVRDDAWRLERRQERGPGDDATIGRVSGVAKLRGLGVQAAGAVSRIAFDRRSESENAISTVSRLDQLLEYDAAAASSAHRVSPRHVAATPEEQAAAGGVLNTSVYVTHRPSVVTRMLLASNVDLVDKTSLAAAAEITEQQHAMVGASGGGMSGFG
jgi:hypothetical protein